MEFWAWLHSLNWCKGGVKWTDILLHETKWKQAVERSRAPWSRIKRRIHLMARQLLKFFRTGSIKVVALQLFVKNKHHKYWLLSQGTKSAAYFKNCRMWWIGFREMYSLVSCDTWSFDNLSVAWVQQIESLASEPQIFFISTTAAGKLIRILLLPRIDLKLELDCIKCWKFNCPITTERIGYIFWKLLFEYNWIVTTITP